MHETVNREVDKRGRKSQSPQTLRCGLEGTPQPKDEGQVGREFEQLFPGSVIIAVTLHIYARGFTIFKSPLYPSSLQ